MCKKGTHTQKCFYEDIASRELKIYFLKKVYIFPIVLLSRVCWTLHVKNVQILTDHKNKIKEKEIYWFPFRHACSISLSSFRELPGKDENPRTNFDDFWNAALAVFQVWMILKFALNFHCTEMCLSVCNTVPLQLISVFLYFK